MKRRLHCAHLRTANQPGMTLKRLRSHAFLRKSAGFTLMEMVMTITIMGVLAGVATSYWPSDNISKVKALQLEQDIRSTQIYAVSTGVDRTIRLVAGSNNRYEFLDENEKRVERPLEGAFILPSDFHITFNGALGDPRNALDEPLGDLTIILTPIGGDPAEDGRQIQVAANTGAVWLP